MFFFLLISLCTQLFNDRNAFLPVCDRTFGLWHSCSQIYFIWSFLIVWITPTQTETFDYTSRNHHDCYFANRCVLLLHANISGLNFDHGIYDHESIIDRKIWVVPHCFNQSKITTTAPGQTVVFVHFGSDQSQITTTKRSFCSFLIRPVKNHQFKTQFLLICHLTSWKSQLKT